MAQTDASDRTVISVSGSDRLDFLQGLITNDIAGLSAGLVYSALLTPQGKYLFDFFLFEFGDAVMIDTVSECAPELTRLLNFYRLRRSVAIDATDMSVARGLGNAPPGGLPDPRSPHLGWRRYGGSGTGDDDVDWDSIRVDHCVPETGIELIPNVSYILEVGFERLNGVDFHKGCYVGQEVTARMKHKAKHSKGLATVEVEGDAPFGAEVLSGERKVGSLFTRSGKRAIAFLRFDRIRREPLHAGDSVIRIVRVQPGEAPGP